MESAQLLRIVGVAIDNALLCLYSSDPCRRCVSREHCFPKLRSDQTDNLASKDLLNPRPSILTDLPTSSSILSAMDRFYVTQGADYCGSPMSFANVPELMPCAYDDASTDPSPSPPMVSLSPRAPIKPIAK